MMTWRNGQGTKEPDMRILLVEENADQRGDIISDNIVQLGWNLAHRTTLSPGGIRLIGEGEFDLLIISADRLDTALINQLGETLGEKPSPVLLQTRSAEVTAVPKAVALGIGALRTAEPIMETLPALATEALARFRDRAALLTETGSAQKKLADRIWIERAKGLLMNNKGLSEDEAFRKLRKISMETSTPLAKVAEQMMNFAQQDD